MSDILKLENQLCHRFYAVSNALTRVYRPLLKSLDITYPQYVVMMGLWEEDAITIQVLLQRTRIDGGAMSLILKKLQAKGYIDVKVGEQDKRARFIHLTEAGRAAKAAAEDIPKQLVCKINRLNNDELAEMRRLIDLLSDDLQDTLCMSTDM